MEQDYHAWLLDQAAALRAHDYELLDSEHVAEELEAMAARERRELKARLTTLLEHLLKLRFQSGSIASRGWRVTVTRSRIAISGLLADNPSLQTALADLVAEAYQDARRLVSVRLGKDALPLTCPWQLQQITDPDFFG